MVVDVGDRDVRERDPIVYDTTPTVGRGHSDEAPVDVLKADDDGHIKMPMRLLSKSDAGYDKYDEITYIQLRFGYPRQYQHGGRSPCKMSVIVSSERAARLDVGHDYMVSVAVEPLSVVYSEHDDELRVRKEE